MGGRDSYSKRKSSKKKREKTSSQKKSRKKQSKKVRRIHGSVSSSSNSEHTSLSPSKSDRKRIIHKSKKLRRDYSMPSSSKDHSVSSDFDSSLPDYKLKEARRLKNQARKRSTRPKDDEDALRSGKKRKRSGRDGAPKPKKKLSNKMPKKYSSSDSESCSTCKSDSSNSNADDSKRKRGKIVIDNRKERPRGRDSYDSHKKRKYRSSSCSSTDSDRGRKHTDVPLSLLNNNNNNINNNSRRLRSVIAVVDQRYDEVEENRWEMDSHKDEIVYDPNDYPSPKNLDLSEGRDKFELDNLETVAGGEIIDRGKSRLQINELDQDNYGDLQSKAFDVSNFEKGKEIDNSLPVNDLGGDVLESILRQKALENLKKFKGRLQTGRTSTSNNSKLNHESNVNRSFDLTVEKIQNESTKGRSDFQEMNTNSRPSQNNDPSQFKEVKLLLDSENVEELIRISGPSQKIDFSPLKQVNKLSDRDISRAKKVKKFSDCDNDEKIIRNSENIDDESGTRTQIVEHRTDGAELLKSPEEGKCVSSDDVLAEPLSRIETCEVAETTNAGPVTEEHSLKRENEANDGSQYQQKTMSVMRGGEMVQVSYKVYIPKKAAALARRPLKR